MNSKNIKIAFLLGTFPKLSETFILSQVIGLSKLGYEMDIYPLKYDYISPINIELKKYGILDRIKYIPDIPKNKYYRIIKVLSFLIHNLNKKSLPIFKTFNFIRYGRNTLSLRLFFEIIPFLNENVYDIIHCQYGTHGLRAIKLKELGILKGKLVTSFRGFDLSKAINEDMSKRYSRLFEEGDIFLPVCNYFKEKLLKMGCEERKIIVHHGGIDCNMFNFSSNKANNGPTVLLSIGRLVEKKGIEYGLKAFKKVLEKNNNVNIIYKIIGEGPVMENLKKLAFDLEISKNVEFLGKKNSIEIADILKKSHILIAPSITASDGDQEGIPNAIKEAMATSLPVISTYHSGIPELIKNGYSGFLVDEKNIDELSAKISLLVDNPEMRMNFGISGRRIVKEEFDMDKQNEKLTEIYTDLLRN